MSDDKHFVDLDRVDQIHEYRKKMLVKLDEFLHSYFELLEFSGGPIGDYDPRDLIEEALETAEENWLESITPEDENEYTGEEDEDDEADIADDEDDEYFDDDEDDEYIEEDKKPGKKS